MIQTSFSEVAKTDRRMDDIELEHSNHIHYYFDNIAAVGLQNTTASNPIDLSGETKVIPNLQANAAKVTPPVIGKRR